MGVNPVIGESIVQSNEPPEQLDMFCDYETLCCSRECEEAVPIFVPPAWSERLMGTKDCRHGEVK